MPEVLELVPTVLDRSTLRFAIAVAEFNKPITDKLLTGCIERFSDLGVPTQNLLVVRVPGAFELPLVCQALAERSEFVAIVALGCVIRGETTHYDQVCDQAAAGLLRVGLDYELPVMFGVLTTEDADQAWARAGGDHGNKGADMADAALHMCGVMGALQDDS